MLGGARAALFFTSASLRFAAAASLRGSCILQRMPSPALTSHHIQK
jgi:hypothetical protein